MLDQGFGSEQFESELETGGGGADVEASQAIGVGVGSVCAFSHRGGGFISSIFH